MLFRRGGGREEKRKVKRVHRAQLSLSRNTLRFVDPTTLRLTQLKYQTVDLRLSDLMKYFVNVCPGQQTVWDRLP